MNQVIVTGKVIDIDYKLVDKGKIYGIASIKLKIGRTNCIKVVFLNELADSIYRESPTQHSILVMGYLREIKEKIVIIAEDWIKWDLNQKRK